MNDLEQRVSERLRDDADAFLRHRGPAAMPVTVTRRIRHRQTLTLVTALVIGAGTAIAAIALTSAITDGPFAEERPGGAPAGEMRRLTELDEAPGLADPAFEYPWRGLWPEVTEPAARASQQLASEPGSESAWRLQAKSTATAYAREVFGWKDVIGIGEDLDLDSPQRLRVSCPGCDGSPEAEVILERVEMLGGSTIWSVTGLRVPQTPEGDELARLAVEDLVQRRAMELTSLFMQYRIDGSTLAEAFLAPEAATAYHDHEDDLYLYGAGSDEPDPQAGEPGAEVRSDSHPRLGYGGFDIVDEPRPVGDGTLETVVSLDVFATIPGEPWGRREVLRIGAHNDRLMIVSAERFAD